MESGNCKVSRDPETGGLPDVLACKQGWGRLCDFQQKNFNPLVGLHDLIQIL